MIAESDCTVSEDNVFDNDDDDDHIASPDVDSEIEDHVSDTILKNQTTTYDAHCTPWSYIVVGKQEESRPGETEKEEEEDEQAEAGVGRGRDWSRGNAQGLSTSQQHDHDHDRPSSI